MMCNILGVFALFIVAACASTCSEKCTINSTHDISPVLSSSLTADLVSYNKTVWSPDGRHYVFTDVLADKGWFVVFHPQNATFIWTTGFSDMPKSVLAKLRLGDGQIWNQIEDSWYICDKERLHTLLAKTGKTHIQPLTFSLKDQKECVEFFKTAALQPEIVWLTKDPGSSQGDGIKVNPDIKELRDIWLADPESEVDELRCVSAKKAKSKNTVAQQYILHPLTLDGKKNGNSHLLVHYPRSSPRLLS